MNGVVFGPPLLPFGRQRLPEAMAVPFRFSCPKELFSCEVDIPGDWDDVFVIGDVVVVKIGDVMFFFNGEVIPKPTVVEIVVVQSGKPTSHGILTECSA